MVGTKITALAEDAAPDAAADWLTYVDVSDTSMAASGTNQKLHPNDLRVSMADAASGSSQRSLRGKFAEVISAQDFGATGNGSTDDTAAMQAFFTYLAANPENKGYISGGRYKITAPIILCDPSSGFAALNVEGDGAGYDLGGGSPNRGAVVIDHSSMLTDPAFVIQGARRVRLAHIGFYGPNVAPSVLAIPEDDVTNYLTGGVRDNRYSPQCAIVIDPFATDGSAPAGNNSNRYPALIGSYAGTHTQSASIEIDNCSFVRQNIGVMVSPHSTAIQGDSVRILSCWFYSVHIGIASGQAQARALELHRVDFGFARYAFDGRLYGKQQGAGPAVFGGQYGFIHTLFSFPKGWGTINVVGIYAESVCAILGSSTSGSSSQPVICTGCLFYFRSSSLSWLAPMLVQFGGPVTFYGCLFNDSESGRPAWNFVCSSGSVTFIGCEFDMEYAHRPFIGNQRDFAYGMEFIGCWITDGSNRRPLSSEIVTDNFFPRITAHWTTREASSLLAGASYKFVQGYASNYMNTSFTSKDFSSATTPTITMSSTAAVAVGDVILWVTNTKYGDGNQWWLPALYVDSKSATVLTCHWLMKKSDIDTAFSSTELNVLVPAWAPSTALTGTTANGSASVTGVSRTDILQVGDHVQNTGGTIPGGTRIVAISGTTLTLSQNCSGASSTQLFSSRLHTVTSTPAI